MKTGLYLPVTNNQELIINNMLTNVTNKITFRQLLSITCFIIHVGLYCIGVHSYA